MRNAPPAHPTDRRVRRYSAGFTMRVTADQAAALREAARAAGLGITTYLRQTVLDAAAPPAAPTATAAAVGRLGAAGRDLDELAGDLARHGAVGPAAALRALAAETIEIRRLLLAPASAEPQGPGAG